ncbi:hypothetical protein CPC08DRAFT_301159 [Agrocybe pediades]|nr:hypothetical protein CPC08DRAFT_301159 [Agrocybe pediades]
MEALGNCLFRLLPHNSTSSIATIFLIWNFPFVPYHSRNENCGFPSMIIPSRTRIPLIIIFRDWACFPPALSHRLPSSSATYLLYPVIISYPAAIAFLSRQKSKVPAHHACYFPFTPFLSLISIFSDGTLWSFRVHLDCIFFFVFLSFKHCFKAIFNPRVHPYPCTCFHCIFIFVFSSPRRPLLPLLSFALLALLLTLEVEDPFFRRVVEHYFYSFRVSVWRCYAYSLMICECLGFPTSCFLCFVCVF